MTAAAGLLAAPLWLAAAAAAAPALDAPAATQKIAVEVRGPVALVQVTRTLTSEGASAERLLDVALPERAALVDVAVGERGKWRTVEATAGERASHAYVEGLAARGGAPAREPIDDGTTFRVRVAADPRAPVELRYRFSLLPETSEDRRRIRFPGSPERQPVPAEVTTSIADARDVQIAGVRATRGRASTRAAWEISWAPRATGARLEGDVAFARLSATETLAAVSVDARGRRPMEPPPNVLLLVDRSRSVGLPGLAAERDLAGRLLEALPPATRFDALFFDRQVRRLFPMSRPATREALAAFEAEMVPDRLQNGTDLAAALRDAGALLRREASAFAPRTLLAIVTDGALPDGPDGAALARALGAAPGVEVTVGIWIVRPAGDDPAPPAATRALRELAAAHGGVVRELAASELGDALPPALAALARGGDLAEVRLVAGRDQRALAARLAPGDGHAEVVRVAAPGAFGLAARADGGAVQATPRARVVEAAWLRALSARGAPAAPRLLATDALVALVEPTPHEIPVTAPVKGALDRTVVRNTLSLAYMPRARACYLTRTSATPAERDLTGRVRLAIDLARGEVGNAVVESSTLAHPGIEACLREGAFAIEVPRALANDAPSTAVLNLVFRPRTPEKHATAQEAALGEQIDVVIEELHRSEPAPDEESPAPDRSMIPTR